MNNEPKKKSAFADEWFGAGIALGVAFGIIFENKKDKKRNRRSAAFSLTSTLACCLA